MGWRGSAFGLDLEGHFEAPGLEGVGAPTGRRPTTLRLDPDGPAWPPGAEEVQAQLGAGEALSIGHHPAVGYRLRSERFGSFVVSPGGESIACAPAPLDTWQWQRMLVGQVLPLAAVLQGLEVFHCSGVHTRGRTLLFAGGSSAGKSSVALHQLAAGADLVADDVVAVEPHGEGLLVHPGAAVMSVDRRELAAAGAIPGAQELGRLADEVRLAVPPAPGEIAPGLLFYLRPLPVEGELVLREVPAPEPARLLAAGFIPYVRDQERLRRQLEAAGRLAAVEVVDVEIPTGVGAAAVAAAVADYATRGRR